MSLEIKGFEQKRALRKKSKRAFSGLSNYQQKKPRVTWKFSHYQFVLPPKKNPLLKGMSKTLTRLGKFEEFELLKLEHLGYFSLSFLS